MSICSDASFGYPGGPILFKNLNFGIDLDSRIASKYLETLFFSFFIWGVILHSLCLKKSSCLLCSLTESCVKAACMCAMLHWRMMEIYILVGSLCGWLGWGHFTAIIRVSLHFFFHLLVPVYIKAALILDFVPSCLALFLPFCH